MALSVIVYSKGGVAVSTMHTMRFTLALVLVATLLAACGGTAPQTGESSPVPAAPTTPPAPAPTNAPAAQTGATWSPDEIKAATGKDACAPLAQLPKQFKQPWKLGFINPNKGYPFWGAISQSMQDAAKFYGVEFYEVDAAGDTTKYPDLMETLLLN